jgi:hypothetical protein
MQGSTLVISPDPFAGCAVDLRVVGHRIPAGRYRDDAQVRRAIARATPEIITGTARGV